MNSKRNKILSCVRALLTATTLLGAIVPTQAADKKLNILILWGGDIGFWNVSAYNQGKSDRGEIFTFTRINLRLTKRIFLLSLLNIFETKG